jgi:two-component system, LuxR family, sensor kinase FixL
VVIGDVAEHPVTRAAHHCDNGAYKFRSFLGAPMLKGQRVVGLLGLYSVGRPYAFGDMDRVHLQIAANQAAAILVQAELGDALVQQTAERRALENQLREQDRLYRHIVTRSTQGIWLLDDHDRTSFVNDTMLVMMGRSAEELIGRTLLDLVDPAEREVVSERLRQRRQGTSQVHEFAFTHDDGRVVWTLCSTHPLLDDAGVYRGSVAMFADITELKRAQSDLAELNAELERRVEDRTEDLRRVEERYRLLTESASDMISWHDPAGRFTYCSPACTRILGFEPHELEGRDPYEFHHPDDVAAVRHSHDRVLAAPVSTKVTYRHRRKDGSYAWLESSSRMVMNPATGTPDHIVVVSRDLSERAAAEEQLRLIRAAINGVSEAVVVTEPQLEAPGPRIVYVNPAFCAMTGYREREAIGQTPRLLQGPATDRATLSRLRATLSAGEPFVGETTNYRKDGQPYVVAWNVNPVRDAAGRITHFVSIQRDVTQQRSAEQQAREQREQLAHVSRLSTMGEMASGLAHELNQPLAAIANYAHGLQHRMNAGRADEPTLRETLARIAGQAERAGAIIKRLRAFVSKRDPQSGPVSLNDLVHGTLTLCAPEARDKGVKLEHDLHLHLPRVKAEAIEVQQVLVNLIRNGVEACEGLPADRRWVRVRTRPAERGTVDLTVTDAGHGITAAERDRLFHPFYTTKSHGMGMGLTISRSIAERHRGRLTAEQNQPHGTVFRLTLPAVHEPPGPGTPSAEDALATTENT